MQYNLRWGKQIVAVLICATCSLPAFALFTSAGVPDAQSNTPISGSITNIMSKVADDDTSQTYQEILGNESDGGRYAGRIWTDKTILTGDFTETTERQTITVQNDSDFLAVFSALGSSRSVNHFESSPIDMVFMIDISTSMGNYNYVAEAGGDFPSAEYHGVLDWSETRLEKTLRAVEAASARLYQLNPASRISIVAYGRSAAILLPLDNYEAVKLSSQDLGWANAWFHYFVVSAQGKLNGSWTTPITISNESAKLNNLGEPFAKDWSYQQPGFQPAAGSQEAENNIPSNYFYKDQASQYLKGFRDHPDRPYYSDSDYYQTAVDGYGNYDYYLVGSTNFDAGLYVAMDELTKVPDTTYEHDGKTVNRVPAILAMTDGNTNCITVGNNWYTPGINGSYYNASYPGDSGFYTASTSKGTPATTNQDASLNAFPLIAIKTIMSAAYMKQRVINHYTPADAATPSAFEIYTVGYDLNETNNHMLAIINPSDNFHDHHTSGNQTLINSAYQIWQKWLSNQPASINISSTLFASGKFLPNTYTFGQLPSGSSVTREDLRRNINYVDRYYTAEDSGNGSQTIDQIFDKAVINVTGAVFRPVDDDISSRTSIQYRDTIGEYMEVKSLKSLLLFGEEYPVTFTHQATDTNGNTIDHYRATSSTGQDLEITNPNYQHHPVFKLSDLSIQVVTDPNHLQTLEVGIPQDALPLRIEHVQTTLEYDHTQNQYVEQVTTYDSNQHTDLAKPLRLLYTIGTQDRIKTTDGGLDLEQISEQYKTKYLVTTNTGDQILNLYSNYYSAPTNRNNTNIPYEVTISFNPSRINRFYYFQKHRPIYQSATGLDAKGEGTLQSSGGSATVSQPLTDISTMQDDQSYYLVIDFYRPTADSDEYVEYVVTRTGAELKDGLTYYHPQTGATRTQPTAGYVVATQIGSKRIGRLSNFTRLKSANLSETAAYAYNPTYQTNGGNGIVVRLGNNGRLQLTIPAKTDPDPGPDNPDTPDPGPGIDPNPDPGTDPDDPNPDQPNPDQPHPDQPEQPTNPTDPDDPSVSPTPDNPNQPTTPQPEQPGNNSSSASNQVPDSGVSQGTGSLSVAFIVVIIASVVATVACISYLHWRNER